MRSISFLPRWAVLFLAALALVLAGCGDDDDGDAASSDDEVVENEGDENDEDTADAEPADDAAEDSMLGWQLTGEPGTIVAIETVAVSDGAEQAPLDQEFTLKDEPTQMLFSGFIDSAEMTLAVTEGGSVTVEAIRGRQVDPENPFGGIEVLDVLDTIEVPADGSEAVLAVE